MVFKIALPQGVVHSSIHFFKVRSGFGVKFTIYWVTWCVFTSKPILILPVKFLLAINRLSWSFWRLTCRSSDFQSCADFILVEKPEVKGSDKDDCAVRRLVDHFRLTSEREICSNIWWKKVRLNFTFHSYFKTFLLLRDVCERTSQLYLDWLYNYSNCWGSK